MAFLAKKGWHPGSMRNQEKVWKREQEAAKEEKRLDELKKQYHEQRQREELDAVAVNAGVKLCGFLRCLPCIWPLPKRASVCLLVQSLILLSSEAFTCRYYVLPPPDIIVQYGRVRGTGLYPIFEATTAARTVVGASCPAHLWGRAATVSQRACCQQGSENLLERLKKPGSALHRKQDRLDWMYKGGMVAKQDAEKRVDEQLLGDRQVELKSVDDTSKVRPSSSILVELSWSTRLGLARLGNK